eukprot:GHVO01048456.1.p1 GENE.GHVO01048456.1~~GHVO01048456.1.p1  ORF type:complete len:112 (-),score=6.14 GHVO01048456.1:219-554(-)
MLQIDSYQVKYHRYAVNIRDSSGASLQLYMALKGFFETIRTNLCKRYSVHCISFPLTEILLHRELFRVSMAAYQDWFQSAVTFWLQTFREECIRRMSKALEIEKDVRLNTK